MVHQYRHQMLAFFALLIVGAYNVLCQEPNTPGNLYQSHWPLNDPHGVYGAPPPTLELFYDPPNNHQTVTVLGVFVRVFSDPDARIYYNENFDSDPRTPNMNDPYCTWDSAIIELNTPFKGSRIRNITIIAVAMEAGIITSRSEAIQLTYFVEGSDRPYGWGFLVPGVQSNGYFVKMRIEQPASARAQVAGSQEFADFFNELGYGPYDAQLQVLNLKGIDPGLNGFEGGFSYNITNFGAQWANLTNTPEQKFVGGQYGILVPYHDGTQFSGKVVRIDLNQMGVYSSEDVGEPDHRTACELSFRMESYDANGNLVVTGHPAATGLPPRYLLWYIWSCYLF